jgi:hypothetical protein
VQKTGLAQGVFQALKLGPSSIALAGVWASALALIGCFFQL